MAEDILLKIREAVYEGEDEEAVKLAEEAIKAGISPTDIIDKGGVAALDQLGEEFDRLEVFLPEVMLGGDAMKAVINAVTPYMDAGSSAFKGKVIIGTAKGDLHDIGKSLVGTQLATHGYDVVDLGVDVPTNKYLEVARAEKADIIAISALLTTSQYYMEELINRLKSENKRDEFFVVVGGGPISAEYAGQIGADGYSRSAQLAVQMADAIVEAGKKPGEALVSKV
ncbi:MAG: corrinoid protein [Eubacteriales bacterium]|nr:corrinoid protein [Eubacteriales bacterium]MDD4324328.1 corrinoid protein [Eubacteriales bacterium]MDD4542118.1 corrinoid protein [Eubacteriales bacterium]